MKNIFLSFFLLITTLFAGAQSEVSVKAYEKGSKALEKKKYHEAIELLTVSIADNPTANAYFNRAVSYYKLGDSCRFCEDLRNASNLKDREAKQMYEFNCLYEAIINNIPTSVLVINPDVKSLLVRKYKCLSDSLIYDRISYSTEILNDNILAKLKENNKSELNNGVLLPTEEFPEFVTVKYQTPIHFITQKLKYPEEARKNQISGTVMMQFIIKSDSSITDVVVKSGLGYGCDEEAIRIVSEMKTWKPGKQYGINRDVLMTLPVRFRLD